MLPLHDHAGASPDELEALRGQVGEHHSLERVVRWTLARGHMIAEIVTQDEYTQDVVIPYDDLGRFLVYDTT